MPVLVSELAVEGFRSIRRARVTLAPLCALVGEPETGKSNLLAALRAVLDPSAEPEPADVPRDEPRPMALEATLGDGQSVRLTGSPGAITRSGGDAAPPVVYLPASARANSLVAPSDAPAAALFRQAAPGGPEPMARTVQAALDHELTGVMLLVEEPELHLRPQGQRLLYRLLRRFVEAGNQVVYATHAPAFLNAARLDEVVFVERLPAEGTRAGRAAPLTPDEDFRVLSEFDAERSELLLARAALLVEGLTEKLAFPFVFAALGLDPDREGVSLVECGGKANIPLFARVCTAAGVPFVAVHDRDARSGKRPKLSERVLNAAVLEAAGRERTVVVEPDFEGIADLPGGARKPEQAWRRFAGLGADEMPEPLTRAVELVVALARGGAG